MIKVGIIGAGYIGGVHASVLARDERVRVGMVYDAKEECARRLAGVTGAEVARSAREVIESSDAVYVTTPNTLHVELAVAAARAGRHVFCEKPMATSTAEARRVVEAAEGSGRVFQVGHNRRFAPVYSQLKRMIEEGARPHSAHVKMNRGELLDPVWTGDASVTGGFLYETTIHMFDMLRFLFGEVRTLYAVGSRHEYAETDDFSAVLTFESGVHATLCSSADAGWLFPFERLEVFCHHRTIVTREMESLTDSHGLEGRHTTTSVHKLSKEEKWGYAQEARAFVDSITDGTPPLVTAEDGYRAVELVEMCYRAVGNSNMDGQDE